MKLSYMDILGDKKRHIVKAKVTTDHPESSYGHPVIVLESDNKALDITSWVLLDYKIVEATPKEGELLERVLIVDPRFHAAVLGRKGGSVTSEIKKKSSAANGKLGGRPKDA